MLHGLLQRSDRSEAGIVCIRRQTETRDCWKRYVGAVGDFEKQEYLLVKQEDGLGKEVENTVEDHLGVGSDVVTTVSETLKTYLAVSGSLQTKKAPAL